MAIWLKQNTATTILVGPLVDSVDAHSVYYSWEEKGQKKTHSKEHFAFQCRYSLVLPKDGVPDALRECRTEDQPKIKQTTQG